jgi:hypothetical protein
MYNPDLGTFDQRDPIKADMNLYRYCGNDPLTHTDPSGLRTCTLATPTVILNQRMSPAKAFGGAVAIGISVDPGSITTGGAVSLHCSCEVQADVLYNCTDTIRVWDYWGCIFWYSNKTYKYPAYVTIHDTFVWTAPVPPVKSFEMYGPALSVGPTGGPSGYLAWLDIPADKQKFADGICQNSTRPKWIPPPTTT